MNIGELKQLQSLPLQYKIEKSKRVMVEAYEMFDGKLYRSIAGNDSAVMDWIVDQCGFTDIPRVSISRAEPKGNNTVNYKKGTTFVRPKLSKKQIIRKYGYPMIYKNLSMAVGRYQKTKFEEQRQYRLHGRINKEGKVEKQGTIPHKWHELIYAPFLLSEKCCIQTKESPLTSWSKKHGHLIPITGEMAEESNQRLQEYLKHNCIMHKKAAKKVTPLGFWTEQDIKRCLLTKNIPYSADYGDIVENDKGLLVYTGEPRTGCDICGFGIIHDPERFSRLRSNYPKKYNIMVDGGGFEHSGVFRWVKFNPSDKPEWSDLTWVPNERGFGYSYVIDWLNNCFNLSINY